ncbi:TfuA-like protein [Actinomadura rupiterrae]|uniref:TfuA-like protein n=1 Tax=Actinomadura rupiterrae TaxID=559627 RepID=UPI0020A3207B|nr:TfuA-like protein [Actinomadura rupiterrae]MCP2342597.1 hypothetical protein [Actinomadura rupiterrae]
MNATELVVFVGPSAHGLVHDGPSAQGPEHAGLFPATVEVRPPVRRGGVAALLAEGREPGALAIVDGTFHSYPSVGHMEIRDALEAGWRVWGLSSMGAIRAAEMRHLGMTGFGAVYRRYAEDPDFDDDEVALLHGAAAPHAPLSEPLIHLRGWLAGLAARERISAASAEAVTAALKHRWYGERTLRLAKELLLRHSALAPADADAELAGIGAFRTKTDDLVRFMTAKPWREARPAQDGDRARSRPSSSLR